MSFIRRYVFRRICMAVLVLIGVSILSFLLIALSGKDPAMIIAAKSGMESNAALVADIRESLGLSKPLYVRYFLWLKGIFTGNAGVSFFTYHPVFDDLKILIPATLKLVGLAMLFLAALVLPLSLVSVRFHNRLPDHLIRVLTIGGLCMPTFWLGFMLLLIFAVKLPVFSVLPEPGLAGYILPALALAFPSACGLVRIFRSTLLDAMNSDYAAFARARGLSPGRILIFHGLRNALPPVITLLCQYFGYMIAGTAVVESVFSLKGLGSYLVSNVLAYDASCTATCVVLVASVFVVSNLAADIVNRLLCPWMVREING